VGGVGHVGIEGGEDGVVEVEVGGVGGGDIEGGLADFVEEADGGVVDVVPEGGIEGGEEEEGARVPGPPEVVGELGKAGEGRRDGADGAFWEDDVQGRSPDGFLCGAVFL
jgi:hypothetical protein